MSAEAPVFRKPRRVPGEEAVVQAAEELQRVLEDCPREQSPRVPVRLSSGPLVARVGLVTRIKI